MNLLNIFHFYYIFVIGGGYVNRMYLFINNAIMVVIHLCKHIILNNIRRKLSVFRNSLLFYNSVYK